MDEDPEQGLEKRLEIVHDRMTLAKKLLMAMKILALVLVGDSNGCSSLS